MKPSQVQNQILSTVLLLCLARQIQAFATNKISYNINSSQNAQNSQPSTKPQHQYLPPPAAIPPNTQLLKDQTSNTYGWLDQATLDILDTTRIPIGQLTNDDVDSISGLMANWAKRKSTHSAIQVETLLKRVVDDHNAGNDSVKVTTRMYTMAIDAWAKTGGKKAAERASEIHRGMVEAYKQTGDETIKPSTISYNAVINAWSKSGCDKEAAIQAEGILEEMLDEWRREKAKMNEETSSTDDENNDIKNSDDSKKKGNTDATSEEDDDNEITQDLDEARLDDSIIKPDVVSFTSVIDTWAKSGKKNGAAKAMNLLKRMEQLYAEEGELGMKPNVYTYSACINAFAKSSDLDAPKRAEALLADMKKAFEAGDMDVKPNVVNYNSVINAWGRCRKQWSAERASEILYSMEDEGVEPDALSYSLVVSAWAHSINSDATRRAEAALAEMEHWAIEKNKAIDEAFDNGLSDHASSNGQFNKEAGTPPSLPAIRVHLDVECYNTVLIALSRRREDDAANRAIAILDRMRFLADNGFETVRPNAKSWNSVLNTLSRANDKDSAERAEVLLHDMHSSGVYPDVFSYAALLHAYQKKASPYAAERADDIVRQMEQLYYDGLLTAPPDVYHYTIVCACWARSGNPLAAQRCWEILQHMEKRVELGFSNCKPNTRTFNAVIDAYARGHHVDEAEKLLNEMIERYNNGDNKVKPDGFTFNAVINAWTRSRRKDCGVRAEIILKRLLAFHENGNSDVRPDSRSFSHIIDYYARSRERDAGKKAEWLLLGMIKTYEKGYNDVLPSIFNFSSVISTFAKSREEDAGINAERVLHMLNDFHKKNKVTSLSPNTFVINTLLHAWSKSGHAKAGERTEEILNHIEEEYQSGKSSQQPNTRTYGLVLASWAKSPAPNKAEKARAILKKMEQQCESNELVTMNVHCYNAVINAAAFTEGGLATRLEAFKIATRTLDDLFEAKDIDPISSTFGTYIKACGKLSLPRDVVEPAIEKSFNISRDLGLVNDFVLTQILYSTCNTQYEGLLRDILVDKDQNEKIDMTHIPDEWKRNVFATLFEDRGEWWKNEQS